MIRNFAAGALVASALFVLSAPAHATDVSVDCDAGDSLQQAIWGLDLVGPHFVFVAGTCHENVGIYQHDRIVIWADRGATLQAVHANGPALFIGSSRNIEIYGLTIRGGRAGINITAGDAYITANWFSDTDVQPSVVEGSARIGIFMTDHSFLRIDNSIIRNSGRAGISLDNSSIVSDGALTVENNGRNGIAGAGARVFLDTSSGPNYIRGNGANGLSLANTSRGEINGDNTSFEGNAGGGIFAFHLTYLTLFGAKVQNNGDVGVDIQETAHLEAGNLQIRNNGLTNPEAPGFFIGDKAEVYWDGGVVVDGNKGPGLIVTTGGLLSDLGGNVVSNNGGNGVDVTRMSMIHYFNPKSFDPNGAPTAVVGNGGSSLSCDSTSLLAGAVPSVPKTNCSRIERDGGRKPRAGRLNHLTE